MELPIYEEIILKKYDLTSLEFTILQRRLGKRPALIYLPEGPEPILKEIITNILLVFKKHRINPRFPYPIYVIADMELEAPMLPLLRDVRLIPDFFFCSQHRVTNREQNLVTKLNTKRDKLFNVDYDKKMDEIKTAAPKQREIYVLARKEAFYERILKLWKRFGVEMPS